MKQLVAILMLCFVSLQQAAAADKLSQAIRLFDVHRYSEAAGMLDEVISASGADARALYYDALTHHYLGDCLRAEQKYKLVISRFPDSQFAAASHKALEELGAEALPDKVVFEGKSDEDDGASSVQLKGGISDSQEVVEVAPYKKYLEKAIALNGVGDSEKYYLDALRDAENRGPNDPALLEVLPVVADFYAKRQQYDRAERLLTRNLDYTRRAHGFNSVDSALASDKLGRLYLREGFVGMAVDSFAEERDLLEGALYKARTNPRADTSAIRGAIASCLEVQASIAFEAADRISAALLHEQAVALMSMEN